MIWQPKCPVNLLRYHFSFYLTFIWKKRGFKNKESGQKKTFIRQMSSYFFRDFLRYFSFFVTVNAQRWQLKLEIIHIFCFLLIKLNISSNIAFLYRKNSSILICKIPFLEKMIFGTLKISFGFEINVKLTETDFSLRFSHII